jgi:hypothetical protein
MSGMSRLVALCVIGAALSPSLAAGECRWGSFHFMFGSDVPAMANADSGKPCLLTVKPGRKSEFTSVTIAKQPDHGHVTLGSNVWDGWIYTSKPDFHGSDTFVGAVTGKSVNFSGTTHITVTLNVQ